MLNFGICEKCKDFSNVQIDTVDIGIKIDKHGRTKNTGPEAWSCPAVNYEMVKIRDDPPLSCFYRVEQILFFDRTYKCKPNPTKT